MIGCVDITQHGVFALQTTFRRRYSATDIRYEEHESDDEQS